MRYTLQQFFCLALIVIVLAAPAMVSANEPVKVGVIGALQDKVTVRSEDGRMRSLKIGEDVFLNDVLITDGKGKAQVMFLDKSALTITPNSEVTVDEFVYNPADSTGDLTIRSAKGALRFIGGALSKEKPVLIKTPVSTIGIRGGIADAHIAENGATDAIFVFGKEMSVENKSGERLSITQIGSGITVATADSPPAILPPAKVAERLSTFGSTPAASEQSENEDTASGSQESASQNNAEDSDSAETQETTASESSDTTTDNDSSTTNTSVANDTSSVASSSSQTQIRNNGTEQFANNAPPPDSKGFYVLSSNGNDLNRGSAKYNTSPDKYTGLLVAENESGPRYLSRLPRINGEGYHAITSAEKVIFDNAQYTGHTYVSDAGAMRYYYLNEMNGPRELSIAFGSNVARSEWGNLANNSVAASQSAGTNNITFYSFLPDLSYNSFHNGTGFFDYNLIDNNLKLNSAGVASNNMGMAVDWQNKRFFTGFVLWGNPAASNAVPYRRDMMLAFGKVDTSGNGPIMSGRMFEFNRRLMAGGTDYGMQAGYFRVGDSIYAAPGGRADGFIMEGIFPDGTVVSGTDPFTMDADGMRILQPAMVVDPSAALAGETSSRPNETIKGYAAGYVVFDTEQTAGNSVIRRYTNTDPNNVGLQKSATGNSLGGTIKMTDTGGIVPEIRAYMGTNSGQPDIADAYLADDMYAVQQGKIEYVNGGVTTYTGEAGNHGAMVGSALVANVANTCTNCQYVEWGVWASEVSRVQGGQVVYDTAAMVPYVVGTMMQNLGSAGLTGTHTYTGAMYGSTLNTATNALQRHSGTFNANINLSTRQLTGFNANFADLNFGFNSGAYTFPTSGVSKIDNIPVVNLGTGSPSLISGNINMALFGPQAQDVGGNFAVDKTSTNTSAAGVYLGTRN